MNQRVYHRYQPYSRGSHHKLSHTPFPPLPSSHPPLPPSPPPSHPPPPPPPPPPDEPVPPPPPPPPQPLFNDPHPLPCHTLPPVYSNNNFPSVEVSMNALPPNPLFPPDESRFPQPPRAGYHGDSYRSDQAFVFRGSGPSWDEPPPDCWPGNDRHLPRGVGTSYPPPSLSPAPLFDRPPLVRENHLETVRKIVPAETIFDQPGRNERPSHIVIILRGLPGAGKSHLAKLIKEKELHYASSVPRILSIDTYFMNEVEKIEKNPQTGRSVKKKMEEYEYDPELEPAYMSSMLKQFNKTLSEGYFPMVIVDAVNSKITDFDQFWSCAKVKGFEAFVVELKESVEVCTSRNTHNRARKEIEVLAAQWEPTPAHFLQLDVTSLLYDRAIDEVDMEMANSDEENSDEDRKLDNLKKPPDKHDLVKSRWEQEPMNEDMLDKLDGFKKHKHKRDKEEESLSLREYVQQMEEKFKKEIGKPSKKRVRWADLEEAKEDLRKKEIGFTLGSRWSKMTEDEIERILHPPTDDGSDNDSQIQQKNNNIK